jgi:hypothetical protein
LIDTVTSAQGPLRLVDPPPGSRGDYIALSHCWGTSRPYTTKKATIEERRKHIDFEELPKTFQDVLRVARYLGIRYLWIDSICICQDDVHEWQREAANMASIYSNAYLCIAATCASDDIEGFLEKRPRREYVTVQSDYNRAKYERTLAFMLPVEKVAYPNNWRSFLDEPLTRRGWALQERFLAPRILHYASDQMYFECLEEFKSEDGYRFKGRHLKLDFGSNLKPTYDGSYFEGSSSWYRLVEDYSGRKHTFPLDKLPALSGLAQRFKEAVMHDEYVAGVWKRGLLEGIYWEAWDSSKSPSTPSTPTAYRGPSWSWASHDGPVRFQVPKENLGLGEEGEEWAWGKWSCVATVLEYKISIKGDNPFGEIESGYLKLEAPIEPLIVSDWEAVMKGDLTIVSIAGGEVNGDCTSLSLDLPPKDLNKFPQLDLHALFLFKVYFGENFSSYKALLVVPTGVENEYRRVGIVRLNASIVGACAWAGGDNYSLPVTLI